jgi:hypothetical protein
MAEPYEIDFDSYRALRYDLQVAIDTYTEAIAAHASTVGVAAPTATSLVEGIVKRHDGLFVIVANQPEPEKQPLPKDNKYYKSATDKKMFTLKVVEEERVLRAQADKEAKMKELENE